VSRSAALAYDHVPSTHGEPFRTRSQQYRVLGGATAALRRPLTEIELPDRPRAHFRAPYLELVQEPAYVAYSPARPAASTIRFPAVRQPRWLWGTLLGIIALAILASPVFAGGRTVERGERWSIRGQESVLVDPKGSSAEGPVVDTTTAPVLEAPVAQEPARPAADSRAYELIGAPSLSVAQIEAVLQQYGSPAEGLGQALYDLGVRYSIDPAYALAFFVHESACGTKGVARFTHSIGNIRWTEGYESYEGYRSYSSWREGMEDWYRLVTDLYINGWNLRTVDAIIPVYAPTGDNNDPPSYIASVKAMVDSWRGK
jgi:hypothetical protein